ECFAHSARVLGAIFVFSLKAPKCQDFHRGVLSSPSGAGRAASQAGRSGSLKGARSRTTTPAHDGVATILGCRQVPCGKPVACQTQNPQNQQRAVRNVGCLTLFGELRGGEEGNLASGWGVFHLLAERGEGMSMLDFWGCRPFGSVAIPGALYARP